MKKSLLILIFVATSPVVYATGTNDLITVKDGNLVAFCGEKFGRELSRPSIAIKDEGYTKISLTAIRNLPTWRERRVRFRYNKNGVMCGGQFSLTLPLKDGKAEDYMSEAFAELTVEVIDEVKRITAADGKEISVKMKGLDNPEKGTLSAEWEFNNGFVLLCHFKEESQWKLIVIAIADLVDENSESKTELSSKADVKAFGSKSGEIGYITLPSGNKIEMIWCEPGRFFMGAQDCELRVYKPLPFLAKPDDDEYENQDEIPRHMVKITKGFWMGKFPVTQSQYLEIMKQNPSEDRSGNPSKNPVTNVSWDDAKLFCEELYEETGLLCRLPTEAEWEYATRAGTTTAYWWGDAYNSNLAYKANPWGFEDMKGIWHWCLDCYAHDFYKKSPKVDPVCDYYTTKKMRGDKRRVIRGGLDTDGNAARSATRRCQSSGWNNGTFRIVCPSLKGDDKSHSQYEANSVKGPLVAQSSNFAAITETYKAKINRPQKGEERIARSSNADDGSDDMDESEARASTGFRDVARQMRLQATQCRAQAQQFQMNTRQMPLFSNSYADAAMAMSANNMGQVSAQFATFYDRMADEWESLDEEEDRYFRDMKSTTSRQKRTAMFIETKDKLNSMLRSSDFDGAWKLYATTRRAIMAFRRSIDPVQNAEEWVRTQDEYYMRSAMQQQGNLQQNAMNMAMQFFAGANESFNRSLKASQLPSRRCGACNKQYYGYGGCPQCSGPNYGVNSRLVEDEEHPGEKVRIYW